MTIDQVLRSAFAHADAGRLAEAAADLEKILFVQPNHAEALHELGMLHHRVGRNDEAIKFLTLAANGAPRVWRYRFNLGLMLLRCKRVAESVPHLRRVVEMVGDNANTLLTVGSALRETDQLGDAASAYRRAIALKGDSFDAHNLLAMTLQQQGELDEALASFGRALELNPTLAAATSNILLCLNYHDRFSPQEVFDRHAQFGQRFAPSVPSPPPRRSPAGDGRVRIGYLSPDLCQHSVSFFIWPILANHDRQRFAVTCYADVNKPDVVTQQLRQFPERWRDVGDLSDDALASVIAGDQIDILVDLAGHTNRNRMALLARKIAPIQATYLGYPNTSGLSSVDYRITDAVADPPGMTESLHTERLMRLPDVFYCYVKAADCPDVAPLPATAAGRVTFAVFTNFSKVRPAMMELWSQILHAVPQSRLMIQARSLGDPPTREKTARFFAERGIADDRLDLRGWVEFPVYLKLFAEVDIILDTFPFCGHTTSCHALWMGAPLVTLAGQAHRSRMGASILTHLGLAELVAQSEADYVRIASELAGDLPRLADLRAGMRKRMEQSPTMDAVKFTRNLEAAYLEMVSAANIVNI